MLLLRDLERMASHLIDVILVSDFDSRCWRRRGTVLVDENIADRVGGVWDINKDISIVRASV